MVLCRHNNEIIRLTFKKITHICFYELSTIVLITQKSVYARKKAFMTSFDF